jgi:hypothetical protein
MGFSRGNPRLEVPGGKTFQTFSTNTMRITCYSRCLSKIFPVSPFSVNGALEQAYRRLLRMISLCS